MASSKNGGTNIEKFEILSRRALKEFSKNENGTKALPANEILKRLQSIVDENIDSYLNARGIEASERAKYEIKQKDPYLLLNPQKQGNRFKTISLRKFEFLWHYYDMENFVDDIYTSKPEHFFHEAIKSFVYHGHEANGDLLPGAYILKRMSLNAHFKGHISVIRLWVYEEKDSRNNSVLHYKTINSYTQIGSVNSSLKRIRRSKGYILKNQYNSLLLGSINYSHLSEFEGNATVNHYPEIVSLHTASPNSKVFTGFSLANYPDYRKPSVTQCYIERLDKDDNKEAEINKSDYLNHVNYFEKKMWEKDPFIGVRKPSKDELIYLKFVLNKDTHQHILIPEISAIDED